MKYVLDTNILILLLGGDLETLNQLRLIVNDRGKFIIPASVITELYSKALTDNEEVFLKEFLGTDVVFPINYITAKLAGYLRANYRLGLGDALVAAVAIGSGSPLVTRNRRDFKMITELELV